MGKNKKRRTKGTIAATSQQQDSHNANAEKDVPVLDSAIPFRFTKCTTNEGDIANNAEAAHQEEVCSKEEVERADASDSSSEDDCISSEEEEEEDLILEGVLYRNREVASSEDDDSDSDEVKSSSSSSCQKEPFKKKSKNTVLNNKSKKEPEMVQVDFTFHDMHDKYFHGIKTLLISNPIYAPHSSALADCMIDNVSIGTVVSNDDEEDNVFGFASVLNAKQENTCHISKLCLDHVPQAHKREMETILSANKQKQTVGFLIHGRMINIPLEITQVLHEQLVADMDWALKNAEDDEEEKSSIDYEVLIVLALCTQLGGSEGRYSSSSLIYKHFDDEIFAGHSEFDFTFPISGGEGGVREQHLCTVIVMTKNGHRNAMKQLNKLIHGS